MSLSASFSTSVILHLLLVINFFFLVVGCLFLLPGMPPNFLLDIGHCRCYLLSIWTLVSSFKGCWTLLWKAVKLLVMRSISLRFLKIVYFKIIMDSQEISKIMQSGPIEPFTQFSSTTVCCIVIKVGKFMLIYCIILCHFITCIDSYVVVFIMVLLSTVLRHWIGKFPKWIIHKL